MQNIREQRQLKVIVGSKYQGIPFDRPCLRRMPLYSELHVEKPEKWVGIVFVLIGLLAFVVVVLENLR